MRVLTSLAFALGKRCEQTVTDRAVIWSVPLQLCGAGLQREDLGFLLRGQPQRGGVMKLVLSLEMTSALFQDGHVPLWVCPWVIITAEGPGDPIRSEHGLTLGVRLVLWLLPPLGKEGLRVAWREPWLLVAIM